MGKKTKVNKKQEKSILESSEALEAQLSKSEEWVENNKTLVFSILGIIVLVVGGYLFFKHNKEKNNALAQNDMFQAQFWFESDSLELALNGDGNNYGFLEVIENYGGTNAGNLARFYAGVCYLKKGEFEEAINHLSDFNAGDKLLQPRAYALIGDAYMEQSDFVQAASWYDKAAAYMPNEEFSPQYLMKAALAYEKQDNYNNALTAYDKIINDYAKSAQYQTARKHRARIEKKASK